MDIIARDWQTGQAMIQGFRMAERVFQLAAPGEPIFTLLLVVLLGSFLFYCWKAMQAKSFWAFARPFGYIAIMAALWPIALHATIPVTLAGTTSSPQIKTALAGIGIEIDNAKLAVKSGGDPRAESKLRALEDRRRFLKSVAASQHKEVAKTTLLVAGCYIIAEGGYRLVRYLLTSVKPLDPQSRDVQQIFLNAQAQSTALSPVEQALGHQVADCLAGKEVYFEHSQEIGKRQADAFASAKNEAEKNAISARFAEEIAHEKQTLEGVCQQMTTKVAEAIDKAITPEEIDQYTHVARDWLNPLRYVTSPDEVGQEEKVRALATLTGQPEEKLREMSPEDIAKTFLRYKHLQALAKDFQDNAGARFDAASGRQTEGFQQTIGASLMGWMGGFTTGVIPLVRHFYGVIWMFAILAGGLLVLHIFIPGKAWKTITAYTLFLFFLGATGVAFDWADDYAAHLANRSVAVQAKPSGFEYAGAMARGAWDDALGGSEAGVAGGALVAGKPVIKAARSELAKKALGFLASSSNLARGTLAGTVVSVVASTAEVTMAQAEKLNSADQAYQRILAEDVSGVVSPALQEIFSGYLDGQQESIRSAARYADVIHAFLYLLAPTLCLLLFGRTYKAAENLGHTIFGAKSDTGRPGLQTGKV